MIEYLIGVDGGGTGTRVRLATRAGVELAQAQGGPSGLSHGIDAAWHAVRTASAQAFASAGLPVPELTRIAIGLGLAGVHNREWAGQFIAANPGYGAMRLHTDAYTTLLGAHQGQPGAVVAIGTGSVGLAMLADGSLREVGGWGFPAGDEASGAWMGLRAIAHIQAVMDERLPHSAFAQAVIDQCGGNRDAVLVWLGQASQTSYASLAPLVFAHGESDDHARALLAQAGREVASLAHALDPAATVPLALCGGLGTRLRPYLPPDLLARSVAPHGDAARGALRMIALQLEATP